MADSHLHIVMYRGVLGIKLGMLKAVLARRNHDLCQGNVASVGSSSLSPTIDVPFSNKNDMVPPGTSLISSSGSRRETLSRSTASRRVDMRLFDDSPEWASCGIR